MPFELRNPNGLWLLGLLVPLILLYVLKVRRQRLVIGSTWLWQAAVRDLLARSPWRRLVPELPLFLQILALCALALALGQPATRGGALLGDHLAIIVDTSASMGAVSQDGTSRIAQARNAAHEILRNLEPGAQAMIVEAGHDARIASPLDRDRRRLAAAVDKLSARDVQGDLGAAVSLASERLLRLPGDNRLVVITDGALARADSLASVSLPTEVIQVGGPVENAALVRVDVRGGTTAVAHDEQVQVFALVANFGARPRDLFVTLRQRNVSEPLASRRVQLAPGERAPVMLTFEPAPTDVGSGLVVELSPPDALAADDRAFGRVPLGRRLPVVMAPKDGNAWIQRALLADPDVELLGISLTAVASPEVPDDALVVVDGACPTAVAGMDLVVLDPPSGRCRTANVAEPIERPRITSWQTGDPRLRFLSLDGVELLRARRIETEGPGASLVRARSGTVISDISLPGRTGTLVGFDVGDSNWPLQASFVLFVRNLVEQARTHRARGVVGPARTGTPLQVRVPPDVEHATVAGPDGEISEVNARAGLAVVPEVAQAGFYHVSWQGSRPGSVLVAANLTSEAESNTSPRPLERGRTASAPRQASQLESHNDWDWVLAALALLLLAVDAWWLTRRPRPVAAVVTAVPKLPERPLRRGRSP